MTKPKRFRIWDKEKLEWFKPTYEAYKGNVEDLLIGLSGDLSMKTMAPNLIHESMFPGRFEIIETIGLNDIKGNEIFDSYIVRERIGFGTEDEHPKDKPYVYALGVVEWSKEFTRFIISHKYNHEQYRESVSGNVTDWYRTHYGWREVEVVGNLYQHAHLLKPN